MPETENERERAEELAEEEEEKKFPVWIIPLIAGPIILIILIVALTGNRPPREDSPEVEGFNQPKLEKEAGDLLMEANKYYHKAHQSDDQRKRNELLDKAADACGKAIDKLNKIWEHFEEHDIQHKTGSMWVWEKTLSAASQLMDDIVKDRGF